MNSLSWADDLVLLSTSPQGLQKCLDKLNQYAYKWGLAVNSAKTKCMVMGSGSDDNIFHYDNNILEKVNKFKYLGIQISHNGKMKHAIEDRFTRANRALFMLKSAMSTSSGVIDIGLIMKLFDRQITPILTYGCVIWGLQRTYNYLYMENVIDDDVKNTRSYALEVY